MLKLDSLTVGISHQTHMRRWDQTEGGVVRGGDMRLALGVIFVA